MSYLTAFLNSRLFKFAFREYFPELLGDTRKVSKVFFENIPVKRVEDEAWFVKKVSQIVEKKKNNLSSKIEEEEIEQKLLAMYGMQEHERKIIGSI